MNGGKKAESGRILLAISPLRKNMMQRIIAIAALVLFAGICPLLAESVPDSGNDALPAYTILPCKKNCGDFRRARVTKWARVHRPDWKDLRAEPQGSVTLNLHIGADGKLMDVTLVDAIGTREYAENVIAALKKSTFKPATRNGVPVESNLRVVRPYFVLLPLSETATIKRVAAIYEESRTLATSGKLKEAIALLEGKLDQHAFRNDQKSLIYFTLANYYYLLKDPFNALSYISCASAYIRYDHPADFKRKVAQAHMEMAGEMGEYAAILIVESANSRIRTAKLKKFATEAAAIIEGLNPIKVTAKIMASKPEDSTTDRDNPFWAHSLVRRSFHFENIKGQLDHLVLHCEQETIKSQITATAAWDIPPDFTGCSLLVYGTPDTTFNLIESKG